MLLRRLFVQPRVVVRQQAFSTSFGINSLPSLSQVGVCGGILWSLYTLNNKFGDADTAQSDFNEDIKVVPVAEQVLTSDDSFSITQFNILAGNLAAPKYFPYVEPHKLEWQKRKFLIVENALQHNPDIVCLEELTDYWLYFKDEFRERGYESIYLKRPSLHTSSRSGRDKADGCGIFYKSSKFKLEEHEEINYPDIHDRIALAVLLKNKTTGKFLIVGSTHLYWDPKHVDVQIEEANELDNYLFHAKSRWEKKHNAGNIPIVIAGDFNNTPSSPLYKHMTTKFGSKHKTTFLSAYKNYSEDSTDAHHTSCTHRRCYTIDFLWYSSSSVKVTHVGEIPSEEELRSEAGPEDVHILNVPSGWKPEEGESPRGIPNSKYGSDHVPIFAVFQRKDE